MQKNHRAQVADITHGVVSGGACLSKLVGWMVGWLGGLIRLTIK